MTDPDTATSETEAARALHKARGDELLGSLKEGVKTILGAILIALVLRSFGYEPFNIPSESMLPRLLVGDYLFVSKWPYGYSRWSFPFGIVPISGRVPEGEPARGAIAVVKYPGATKEDYIKRVIALPGDIVQMKGGRLCLNGAVVPNVRVGAFVE